MCRLIGQSICNGSCVSIFTFQFQKISLIVDVVCFIFISDFFPNDGTAAQPGCSNFFVSAFRVLYYLKHFAQNASELHNDIFFTNLNDRFYVFETASCSHSRAHELYAASILPENVFIGYACSDYLSYMNGNCNRENGIRMGDPTPRTAFGVFYLETSNKAPYTLAWWNLRLFSNLLLLTNDNFILPQWNVMQCYFQKRNSSWDKV